MAFILNFLLIHFTPLEIFMANRNTMQRQIILNTVKNLNNHPTSEEVYNYIKPIYPSISLGTVYRNLHFLSKSKHIRKVSFNENVIRFDHNVCDHYHFKCSKCYKVIDIPVSDFDNMKKDVSEKYSVQVESFNIVFYGLCKDCLSK